VARGLQACEQAGDVGVVPATRPDGGVPESGARKSVPAPSVHALSGMDHNAARRVLSQEGSPVRLKPTGLWTADSDYCGWGAAGNEPHGAVQRDYSVVVIGKRTLQNTTG